MTIIAASSVVQKLLHRASRIAATDEPVLILGETGSGKDILARWLHANSPRAENAFLPLNCSAFPESLIESELFGYRKGAFTDAKTDKKGLFAAVKGGTIFLDEIGDLPHAVQVKLLRVLDTHEILPIGAHEPERVDFRLVAATHQDLALKRKKGLFREDLFYRISVFVLHLPPLRERLEELPALAEYFLAEINPKLKLVPETLDVLMCYPWPGNIRELRNVVHHAAVLADSDQILPEHLPVWIHEYLQHTPMELGKRLKKTVNVFERVLLQSYLNESGGDVALALRRLGMARSTFYRKLRKSYG